METKFLSRKHYESYTELEKCYQELIYWRNQMLALTDISRIDDWRIAKSQCKEILGQIIVNKTILDYDYTLDSEELKLLS